MLPNISSALQWERRLILVTRRLREMFSQLYRDWSSFSALICSFTPVLFCPVRDSDITVQIIFHVEVGMKKHTSIVGAAIVRVDSK